MAVSEQYYQSMLDAISVGAPVLGQGGYGTVYEVETNGKAFVCKVSPDTIPLSELTGSLRIKFPQTISEIVPVEYNGLSDNKPSILIDGHSCIIPQVDYGSMYSRSLRTLREIWALYHLKENYPSKNIVNIEYAAFIQAPPLIPGVEDREDPLYYLALLEERVEDGMNLYDWVETEEAGLYTLNYYLEQFLGISNILDRASDLIVHRDIKTSNILIGRDEDGSPVFKLADFGSTLISDDTLGHSGRYVGTNPFIAPEVFLHSKDATNKSDQYSLALTIAEALFGLYPLSRPENFDNYSLRELVKYFEDVSQGFIIEFNSTGFMQGINDSYPDSFDSLQLNDITAVFAKALNYDPTQRYDTCSDFILDLREVLNENQQGGRRVNPKDLGHSKSRTPSQ